ncbi:lysozyme [Burkholderia stagnalis]|uniref:lysozyme n=1 Tax=Burkholderia stagnalis TaxID=1503054 RepID=UPI000F5F705C|nr:lysozyme [Burkholderia stagnalis]RQY36512.1 lysozyme [Burkholderia stagnalis]
MKQQRLSPVGCNLIEEFEDDRLEAYPDPATGGAPWTIGRGHTGPDVYKGLKITQAMSDTLFAQDIATRCENIINALDLELTQNQFDALGSFVFNIGPGKSGIKDGLVYLRTGGPSTLLRKLRAKDYAAAAEQFLLWDKANGKQMAGLARRRRAERALFLKAN